MTYSTAADRDAVGAAAVFTGRQRLALLAGFVLLAALRLPQAWVQGRFLGEEGVNFFAYAWHRQAMDALWRSFGGYLNLGANASTLLDATLVQGGLLSLEHAPYLTMGIALVFQALPAVLILTGRGRWLASRRAVIVALLFVVTSPMAEEVFLNTLHIQFHLTLCAALILALDVPPSRIARIGYGAMLFLAPLCGPGAIILLPFFALRALVERDRDRIAQTVAIGAGAALQLLAFFTPSPVRGHWLSAPVIAAILFIKLAAMPMITGAKAGKLGKLVHASWAAHGIGWWFAVLGAVLCFGWLIRLAARDRRDPAIWLIVPALVLAGASFGGGMIDTDPREWFSTGSAERYNFVPIVQLSLALIVLARRPDGRVRRTLMALCGIALISGAISYAKPVRELRDGPAWAPEVAAWRLDHDHPLASWQADWALDLSDRPRPCSKPRSDFSGFADPSYCESYWLSRMIRQTAADKARR